MALYAQCSACGSVAWLDASGDCVAGHPRAQVWGIVDGQESLHRDPAYPKEAREALRVASWQWDQHVEAARKQFMAAQKFGTRQLGSFAGLTLHENALVTPSGTIDIEHTPVAVAVETAGNLMATQRSTLTRMAGGTMVAGPLGTLVGAVAKKSKVHDSRELYIIVESEVVAAAVRCDPDKGAQARQFVSRIQMTAAGAPMRAQQRSEALSQHQVYLDDLVIQRASALAQARQALTG